MQKSISEADGFQQQKTTLLRKVRLQVTLKRGSSVRWFVSAADSVMLRGPEHLQPGDLGEHLLVFMAALRWSHTELTAHCFIHQHTV